MSGDGAPAPEPGRAVDPGAGPSGAVTITAPPQPGATPAPPPPRPLSGVRWPAPAVPPSRRVLVAAAAAGAVAILMIPDGPPGVGWLVAALAVAAAVLVIGWRPLRPPGAVLPRRAALAEAALLPAAVALVGVAALRDAEWLVALCLLTAFGAGSLAVAGRWFRSVTLAALAVPAGALRGLAWVGRTVRNVRRTAGGLRLAASLLVGLGLLAVFAPLLASADAAFARVLGDLLPAVDGGWAVDGVFRFALGASGVVGTAFLLAGPPTAEPARERRTRLRRAEWALPVGLLVLLFALFVGVQLTTMFGSDDHVRRTTGLTYAEYARGGFWQLLAVTVLTLVVIVLGSRWAPTGTPAERLCTRVLLSALAGLTLVIVASALSRMWLYQQAYGFTVLRLLVLTCELWLGFGFVLVLASVLRLRPARGPARGMVVAGVVALLALAVLNPERFVAAHNVARFAATGQIDTDYLSRLSADAVPALAELPEPLRSCTLAPIAGRLGPATDGDWRSANAGRAEAATVLATVSPC